MLKREITKRDSKGRIIEYSLLLNGSPLPDGYIFCKVCGEVKHHEVFSRDKKGKYGKTSVCKPCAAQRARDSYKNRRRGSEWVAEQLRKAKEKGRERKQKAVDLLGGKCNDCGGVFPLSVYDFHHVDPSTKEGNPSEFIKMSDENMKEELAKCVLLCANCHRIRHFEGGM